MCVCVCVCVCVRVNTIFFLQNVEINDFSSSWANGLALCAILHSFLPDSIPFDDLTPTNRRQNFTVALNVAE